MILLDVNVCLEAFKAETPRHEPVRQWLRGALSGPEPVAVLDSVLTSVVRLSTNHRIFANPATPQQALAFCGAVRSAPRTVCVTPAPSTWATFDQIVRSQALRANDVPDAWLAAVALTLDAKLATSDRGFRRFADLRLVDPGRPAIPAV